VPCLFMFASLSPSIPGPSRWSWRFHPPCPYPYHDGQPEISLPLSPATPKTRRLLEAGSALSTSRTASDRFSNHALNLLKVLPAPPAPQQQQQQQQHLRTRHPSTAPDLQCISMRQSSRSGDAPLRSECTHFAQTPLNCSPYVLSSRTFQ